MDISDHDGILVFLTDMPDDVIAGLRSVELSLAAGPELREVVFVFMTFVVEGAEEFAVEGQEEDLGTLSFSSLGVPRRPEV